VSFCRHDPSCPGGGFTTTAATPAAAAAASADGDDDDNDDGDAGTSEAAAVAPAGAIAAAGVATLQHYFGASGAPTARANNLPRLPLFQVPTLVAAMAAGRDIKLPLTRLSFVFMLHLVLH
jgi:hypothetical protein